MPADFDKCVAGGGRVRTKKLKGKKFIRICFPKGGGPSVSGEVKTAQEKKRYSRMQKIHSEVNTKIPVFGDTDGKTIRVNPKKGEVVNTIVHEKIHVKHPRMKEKNVRNRAGVEERKLSIPRQIVLLEKFVKPKKNKGPKRFTRLNR